MKKDAQPKPDVEADVAPTESQPPQEAQPPGGGSYVREDDGTLTRVKD